MEKRENDMKFLSMLKRMLGADHTKEDKADAEGEDSTLDQTLVRGVAPKRITTFTATTATQIT